MELTELGTFAACHEGLSWPWIAFDPSGRRFAFASARDSVASRALDPESDAVVEGPSFALPADLALPAAGSVELPDAEPKLDAREGLHAFALSADGAHLAATGVVGSASVVATLEARGLARRTGLDGLLGPGFVAQAVTFDREGARLWLSAESATETAVLLLDAATHALLGVVKSAPFPPPATHELHLHPGEDAVLLLAACGQDGTFARVARVASGRLEATWTALEGGGIPAGMVGFSADAERLYLAEADELRAHAWPGLKEVSSVPFDDDFVSSFAGAVLDGRILVDGQDDETGEDAVMLFDVTATRAALLAPPVPEGMWAGRLGARALVTVEAKGEPARGRVLRVLP